MAWHALYKENPCPHRYRPTHFKPWYEKKSIASLHTMIIHHQPPHLTTSNRKPHTNPTIENLLTKFKQLFDAPHDLPPPRDHDHHIPYYQTQNPSTSNHTDIHITKKKSWHHSSPTCSKKGSYNQVKARTHLQSSLFEKRWNMAILRWLSGSQCHHHSRSFSNSNNRWTFRRVAWCHHIFQDWFKSRLPLNSRFTKRHTQECIQNNRRPLWIQSHAFRPH